MFLTLLFDYRSILKSRANLTSSDNVPLTPTPHLPHHDILPQNFPLTPLLAKRPMRKYDLIIFHETAMYSSAL
jgi:hypothetical protein